MANLPKRMVLVVIALAFGAFTLSVLTAEKRRIVAHEVVINGAIGVKQKQLGGTFTIEKLGWWNRRIRSTGEWSYGLNSWGIGGACLVVDLNSASQAPGCHHDLECNGPEVAAKGFSGYCVVESGASEGRCWTRPGTQAAYCLVGVKDGTHSTPFVGIRKVYTDLGLGPNDEINWRIHGCLNPAGSLACGDRYLDTEATANGDIKAVPRGY